VILRVSRMDDCVAFYDRLMPFLGVTTVAVRSPDFVYYVGGRTALGIRRAEAEQASVRFEEAAPGLEHLCFRARSRADVDAVHGMLVEMGAEIVRAPEEGPWAPGYYSTSFRDPEGIRLEVNFVPGKGLLERTASFSP
jgi:catechol 2,3-dioxygenase-like lactoylglutathione lyase family enzyme